VDVWADTSNSIGAVLEEARAHVKARFASGEGFPRADGRTTSILLGSTRITDVQLTRSRATHRLCFAGLLDALLGISLVQTGNRKPLALGGHRAYSTGGRLFWAQFKIHPPRVSNGCRPMAVIFAVAGDAALRSRARRVEMARVSCHCPATETTVTFFDNTKLHFSQDFQGCGHDQPSRVTLTAEICEPQRRWEQSKG
jgi:hypothetical protein